MIIQIIATAGLLAFAPSFGHISAQEQPDKIVRTVEDAKLRTAKEMQQLNWMVGEWQFDVTTIHPDGSKETWLTDQRRSVNMERDGSWLRSDIIYPTQPLETQLQYMTFDLVEKRWVSIQFSNVGYRDIQTSEDDFSDGRLEFEGGGCIGRKGESCFTHADAAPASVTESSTTHTYL